MTHMPEGYEPAENSEAKDIVMTTIETQLEAGGHDPHDEANPIELIDISDAVVEALLAAGVKIPADLESSYKIGA